MAVRRHIGRRRDLPWADDAKCDIERQRLLKRIVRAKGEVHILIIGAKQQTIASEIAAKGERSLSICARDQLQHSEARGEDLAHGAGQNRGTLSTFGFAVKPVGVDFEAAADAPPCVEICPLSTAARSIRCEKPAAEIEFLHVKIS